MPMNTHHIMFYCGLKNPKSVRVDVMVEIDAMCNDCVIPHPIRRGDTSDFDPRLFEAEMNGVVGTVLAERKEQGK